MTDTIAVVGQAMGERPAFDIDISVGLGSGGFGVFLTTILVGALLMVFAPAYTNRMKRIVLDDPIDSFFYGLLSLVALVVLTIVLVLTIVGILVVIPLVIAAYLLWAVGSSIAFLAVGERIVDDEDWKLPLLVGAAINGGLALTGIGGLLSFAVGAVGFGAVLKDLRN